MKKHTGVLMIAVFLFSGILMTNGCKKQAPADLSAEQTPPAPAKVPPAVAEAAQTPQPEAALKEDNPAPQPEAALKEDNPATQPAHAGVKWLTSYEEARTRAVKENKDLLINFSGSDWCGFCIKLEKDVFSQAAFAQEAEKYFVFLLVDFPYDTSLQSSDLRKQNERLAQLYRFRGYFPTIYLTTSDGRPYAEAEYKEGGPQAYLEYLLQIRKYRDR